VQKTYFVQGRINALRFLRVQEGIRKTILRMAEQGITHKDIAAVTHLSEQKANGVLKETRYVPLYFEIFGKIIEEDLTNKVKII
jgi:hypothetical protein